MAAAEWVCAQGSESNNVCCSVAMSSFVVPSEVVGAESESCSGITSGFMPVPSADPARSTLSHLAHAGGAAPTAPSCRVLGRDSDQVSGLCPEHLAVVAAGWVCPQRGEINNMWCLVAVHSFFFFFFANP